MKVCLVVSDFAPRIGGIASYNTGLAAGLSESDDVEHVLVLALQGQMRAVEEVSKKLTVRRMPLGNMWRTFWTLRRELFAAASYDVFHAPNIFPIGFMTLIIGKYLLRKPVVCTFFGTDVLTTHGSFWTRRAKEWTLRHTDAAIAFSYSTRALVAARYHMSAEQFPVATYPIPPHERQTPVENIRALYGYDQNDVIVLTVSNLVKRKGTEDLVRALAQISDSRVKLLIVGDGPERRALEALIKDLKLEQRVTLTGRVADVDSFYHHADIFALVSFYDKTEGDVEGMGVVFLEAQQHEMPVIGTRSGGIPEAFVEGESGLLVDERDVSALARAIEQLAKDPDLRKKMGEKGKAFVAERFNVKRVIGEYVDVYRKVMATK